jgi:hypothetical protein
MKNLRKIYTASLLLLSSIVTYGQKPYIDSICVQIDDNIELSMGIYEYSDLAENVEKDLKSLQSILKDNSDIPKKVSYSIFYEPDKLLSIKQTEPIEKIIWENGKHFSYQFSNQCNINASNYCLKIQYNELEKLVSDSLIVKIEEVIDTTITIQGRISMTYNYSFQGEKLVHNIQIDKMNGQMDVFAVKFGVGINLIKNQPVIDLSAEMGLTFSKKAIWKNQYYISYNQLSDFGYSTIIHFNGFVNIGYRYNLSNTIGNPNWLGLEFGYLAYRNGDLFGKNTFKFGVNWELGKYISVSPQLYLSGDLTQFYPAVRIGFGF